MGNFNPSSWWVSRYNQRMDYWGGSLPGSRKCECGILDTKWCNCDSALTSGPNCLRSWNPSSVRSQELRPLVRGVETLKIYSPKLDAYCPVPAILDASISFVNALE
ncbi:hypothetical protein ANN_25612 [Periplaneta americana]|uniref:Uncharacterized protein n=1 Tax=Periplaneta americana TaxID=6978 RepID=A0ABQ8S1M7_PERAM|nr:hypothetical protein ANN_25612 [Periplaneta americana]